MLQQVVTVVASSATVADHQEIANRLPAKQSAHDRHAKWSNIFALAVHWMSLHMPSATVTAKLSISSFKVILYIHN